MADEFAQLREQKKAIRAAANALRNKQDNKDELSRQICQKLASLPEYQAAATVMFYVDFGAEVRTQHFLASVWAARKQVVIPCCRGDHLELFDLRSLDELAPSTFGILEPKPAFRGRGERKVDVSQLDLVVVPGVAFDPRGGRVGHGRGYYDRLLRQAAPRTTLVAICFQCQIFPEVPMTTHDVFVDKIVTETAIYERTQSR